MAVGLDFKLTTMGDWAKGDQGEVSLYAGPHGRSIWSTTLSSCAADAVSYAKPDGIDAFGYAVAIAGHGGYVDVWKNPSNWSALNPASYSMIAPGSFRAAS